MQMCDLYKHVQTVKFDLLSMDALGILCILCKQIPFLDFADLPQFNLFLNDLFTFNSTFMQGVGMYTHLYFDQLFAL